MNRHGMTLVELMLAITLGSILLLVMTVQCLTNIKFQKIISNDIAVSQESELAMYNMVQVLRFAIPSSVIPATWKNDPNYPAGLIKVQIQGQHLLPDIPSDKWIEYGLKNNDKNLYYIPDTAHPDTTIIIARNIATLTSSWDSANNRLTINLSAEKEGREIVLHTTLQLLPN